MRPSRNDIFIIIVMFVDQHQAKDKTQTYTYNPI